FHRRPKRSRHLQCGPTNPHQPPPHSRRQPDRPESQTQFRGVKTQRPVQSALKLARKHARSTNRYAGDHAINFIHDYRAKQSHAESSHSSDEHSMVEVDERLRRNNFRSLSESESRFDRKYFRIHLEPES